MQHLERNSRTSGEGMVHGTFREGVLLDLWHLTECRSWRQKTDCSCAPAYNPIAVSITVICLDRFSPTQFSNVSQVKCKNGESEKGWDVWWKTVQQKCGVTNRILSVGVHQKLGPDFYWMSGKKDWTWYNAFFLDWSRSWGSFAHLKIKAEIFMNHIVLNLTFIFV